MFFKIIYMFFAGFVTIEVEGFFIERFLNICRNKNILLQDLSRDMNTYIKVKILKSDFKDYLNNSKFLKSLLKSFLL